MKLALILAAAIASLSALLGLAPSARAQAPAKRRKKTAAARAKKKAPESRYKSTALSQGVDEHYLFDEDGNPIDKKKPAARPKKKAPSADDAGGDSGLKTNSDADAL